jgi:molybdopterin-guanine dinucleotide biosynthesis protein A
VPERDVTPSLTNPEIWAKVNPFTFISDQNPIMECLVFGCAIDGTGKNLKRREGAPGRTEKPGRTERTAPANVSGVILAGGKSKRMGVNKALLVLEGASIIERVIENLGQILSEIIVVTNDLESFADLDPGDIPIKMVKDIHPGVGALGGLHSGLYHAAEDLVFVCACDMPFIDPGLVEYIIDAAKGYDAAVPVIGRYYEPLMAAYSKTCIESIEKQIGLGKKKIKYFFRDVRLRKIAEAELRRIDGELLSLFNINSPEDLVTARRILVKRA